MEPPAAHGNRTLPAAPGASAQRRGRSHVSAPSPARNVHPVPEDRGTVVSLAFREAENGVLPPMGHPTILIIDDDAQSRQWLAATLSVEGFDVVTATDGTEGVAQVLTTQPSLILLDMELGDSQGLSVYRRICAVSAVPVIMVTARHDELDAVVALEAGAADHIIKPPRPRELTARIRAVLRRVGAPAPVVAVGPPDGVYSLGPVRIDMSLRQALVRDREVELSRKEFDLLALLVSEAGNVVTRAQCMERIWRDRAKGDSRTLDTHVKRLRKKVELMPAEPQHVLTVRGIGYRFKP